MSVKHKLPLLGASLRVDDEVVDGAPSSRGTSGSLSSRGKMRLVPKDPIRRAQSFTHGLLTSSSDDGSCGRPDPQAIKAIESIASTDSSQALMPLTPAKSPFEEGRLSSRKKCPSKMFAPKSPTCVDATSPRANTNDKTVDDHLNKLWRSIDELSIQQIWKTVATLLVILTISCTVGTVIIKIVNGVTTLQGAARQLGDLNSIVPCAKRSWGMPSLVCLDRVQKLVKDNCINKRPMVQEGVVGSSMHLLENGRDSTMVGPAPLMDVGKSVAQQPECKESVPSPRDVEATITQLKAIVCAPISPSTIQQMRNEGKAGINAGNFSENLELLSIAIKKHKAMEHATGVQSIRSLRMTLDQTQPVFLHKLAGLSPWFPEIIRWNMTKSQDVDTQGGGTGNMGTVFKVPGISSETKNIIPIDIASPSEGKSESKAESLQAQGREVPEVSDRMEMNKSFISRTIEFLEILASLREVRDIDKITAWIEDIAEKKIDQLLSLCAVGSGAFAFGFFLRSAMDKRK